MVVSGCLGKETHLQLATWVVCGILESLLKTRGASLSGKSLPTPLVEVEPIVIPAN